MQDKIIKPNSPIYFFFFFERESQLKFNIQSWVNGPPFWRESHLPNEEEKKLNSSPLQNWEIWEKGELINMREYDFFSWFSLKENFLRQAAKFPRKNPYHAKN